VATSTSRIVKPFQKFASPCGFIVIKVSRRH
jgi:hypothetical protein